MHDWEMELIKNKSLFTGDKRHWTPEEMSLAYHIYNSYHGTRLTDTGCGSCRRSVLANVKRIALGYNNNANDN
jgi:hypothetical protein